MKRWRLVMRGIVDVAVVVLIGASVAHSIGWLHGSDLDLVAVGPLAWLRCALSTQSV